MTEITFVAVTENDFETFKTVRKAAMREHVDRQGLPWIEEDEDRYHRELFDTPGLRKIFMGDTCVGFVGVREEGDAIELGRFCIDKAYQRQGIGSRVMQMIFNEPDMIGRKFFLNVLLKSWARQLFEKSGFVQVREDKKFAYYERPREIARSQLTPANRSKPYGIE